MANEEDILEEGGLLDRAITRIKVQVLKAWDGIAGKQPSLERVVHPDVPEGDEEFLENRMHNCLRAQGGEVAARANTVELGKTYLDLSEQGKLKFLTLLCQKFDTNHDEILVHIEQLRAALDDSKAKAAESSLRQALEPTRVKILRQFSSLPEGIKFLVDMRADLLTLMKANPALQPLEADLKQLLITWFDIGLLDLRQITWEAPASLLEKLVNYEAVHHIRSWGDLKNRLDSDRKCYAFFHPKMPGEPLIFVEIALTNTLSDTIEVLLDEYIPDIDPLKADTAIFYSISNTQAGLSGISFGNFLIKQVVNKLRHELPELKHFATLSPIPGFRRWLDTMLEKKDDSLFKDSERAMLIDIENRGSAAETLHRILKNPEWHVYEVLSEAIKPVLMRLCAQYLLAEKAGKKALDPVAHFHLSNGAEMHRLNWLADSSKKGLLQSAGMMVNYRYDLETIESNHELYRSGQGMAVSEAMERWV